jgi:hypothetical protein
MAVEVLQAALFAAEIGAILQNVLAPGAIPRQKSLLTLRLLQRSKSNIPQ